MQLARHIENGQLLYLSKNNDDKNLEAISISENEHYRWITFEDVIQSVMHKRKPSQLTLPHQSAMLLPLLFFKPANIVELGLGGGNFARYLTQLSPNISFTTIECNPIVIACFDKYFNPQASTINIIESRAEHWLTDKTLHHKITKNLDWLICDVYQQQLSDFSETIKLLEIFINTLSSNTCLSINLPDSSDQDVNLCLTVLQQIQKHHRIVYFHVPNYLNVIIHLVPVHWPIDFPLKKNTQSYLPKRTYQHGLKSWQHLKEI